MKRIVDIDKNYSHSGDDQKNMRMDYLKIQHSGLDFFIKKSENFYQIHK